MATTFHQRPSQIVGVESTWAAYCLDAAVCAFGTFVENKLSERDKWGRPRYDLERLLSDEPHKGRFADPGGLMKLAGKKR